MDIQGRGEMKRKKSQSRTLVKQKFVVEATTYTQLYPFTTKATPSNYNTLIRTTHHTTQEKDNVFTSTITANSLEEAIERLTHKKQNIRGLKQMIVDQEPNCSVDEHGRLEYVSKEIPKSVMAYSQNKESGIYKWHKDFYVRYEGRNFDFGCLTELERKERYDEVKQQVEDTSNAIINGDIAIAWKKEMFPNGTYTTDGKTPTRCRVITIYKVSKVEHKQMKSNYIKSNSKLAKWIHKRFVKYADQLGVSVPPYYINRRDIVERMGEYAVAHTNDSYCIGFCWYGSGVIWIDVNYHDLKWGSDQKEFRKNIDHTIAHEMVHLRFNNPNDPEHVDHGGSKRRRAFDRRVNQVIRGKRY